MDNLALVRKVYEAFDNQDLVALLELTHPECVVTQDSSLPWGGTFVGHEGVTSFAMLLLGTVSSTLATGELFEADGKVIQSGRTSGTVLASGKAFDVPEVHVWTIKDNKIIGAHFSIDTPAMAAALA